MLKAWHSSYFKKRHSVEDFIATQEYYNLAPTFFKHSGLSPLETRVWELHTDAVSVRDIADIITREGQEIYKTQVGDIVKALSDKMKATFK